MENLFQSIGRAYIHFNRVDGYVDFQGADIHDGQQLPQDITRNRKFVFEKSPSFSAADYYDQSRARTYASCFSMENSNYIWNNYANNTGRGKVCLVFDSMKLRSTLNHTFVSNSSWFQYNSLPCIQIFSLDYGKVEYVDWDRHESNAERLQNPIKYIFMKHITFASEKEFRISLSALGIGHLKMKDGQLLEFPWSLSYPFDFRTAFTNRTITEILIDSNSDKEFLFHGFREFGIKPAEGSDLYRLSE